MSNINLDDTQPKKPVDATQQLEDTKPKRPENFPPVQTPPPAPAQSQTAPPPPPQAYEQPVYYPEEYYDDGYAGPPRWLLWGVIILFVLGIAGAIGGVFAFREVLAPGQQVRVMGYLPFMEAFLPERPGATDTIEPSTAADPEAAQRLLEGGLSLGAETDGAETDETEEAAEPTVAPEANAVEVTESVVEAEEEAMPPENTAEVTEEAALSVAVLPTVEAEQTQEVTTEVEPTVVPTATEVAVQTTTPPTSEPVAAAPTQTLQSQPQTQLSLWSTNARNYGFRHVEQGWNNCGPANITMALSYYGWTRSQDFAASYIRPSDEDKNVSPHELVRFVNEQSDINALWRMGGDLDLLRVLLDNEFPVIIERSHMFEGYEWLGHYQTIVGYSDAQQVFFIYDSFLGNGEDGEGIVETYEQVDTDWQHFNRIFLVVYEPSQEAQLLNLLGEHENPLVAAEHAFEVAQNEARMNPNNAFAWFNMGTSLTELARYEEAAVAYDRAFELRVPWRMLWYQFGPYEAYYNVGRYQDVLSYAESNLSNGGEYVEETHYWQGRALAAIGDNAGAATAFRNAISNNRLFTDAADALTALNQ